MPEAIWLENLKAWAEREHKWAHEAQNERSISDNAFYKLQGREEAFEELLEKLKEAIG